MIWYVSFTLFVNKPSAGLKGAAHKVCVFFLLGQTEIQRRVSGKPTPRPVKQNKITTLSKPKKKKCDTNQRFPRIIGFTVPKCRIMNINKLFPNFFCFVLLFFVHYVISNLALICFTFIRCIAIDSFDFIYEDRATTFSAVSWITQ